MTLKSTTALHAANALNLGLLVGRVAAELLLEFCGLQTLSFGGLSFVAVVWIGLQWALCFVMFE